MNVEFNVALTPAWNQKSCQFDWIIDHFEKVVDKKRQEHFGTEQFGPHCRVHFTLTEDNTPSIKWVSFRPAGHVNGQYLGYRHIVDMITYATIKVNEYLGSNGL